ncbi:spore germination protein [Ectobacillus sp. JY-23]|uniref:GerAB/ArcD/ProY family transporter n=1 Tax=Ectobacillus sp. JY-23 TaxID=2933872 RepID=UPI001FF3AB3F|nr:endospore germination permease [Ectobacillus sp. JY-23]UOY91265.1 spore germination protein [Ectobacillus sp. JY-23]
MHARINRYQFFILVFFFTIGSSILLTPSTLVSTAQQQGWIAGIITLGVGVLLSLLYTTLGARQGTTSLVTYARNLYGNWLGALFGVYYLVFFMILTALVLRDMGDFMTTQILTETPIMQIHIVLMSLIVYATKLGLTSLSRFGELLFPVFFILFILLFFLVAPEIEYRNMLPLFPLAYKDITKGVISFTGFPFLELSVFLVLQPFVQTQASLKKPFILGSLFGGLILVSVTLQSILVMSTELTSTFLYPSYELAKHIKLAYFLERIEAIMAVLWFISLFLKIAITFWASVTLLGDILKLQLYSYLIIPLAVIILIYSITMSPNVMFIWFSAKVWPFYAFVTGFILPVLLLLRKPSSSSDKTVRDTE